MISSAANRRPWSASQGVVSDEFVTGNGLTSSTAPMISNLFPAGAKPASTGEVILWGYVDDPMSLPRRGRGTHEMVATLKRPPPARRPQGTPYQAALPPYGPWKQHLMLRADAGRVLVTGPGKGNEVVSEFFHGHNLIHKPRPCAVDRP